MEAALGGDVHAVDRGDEGRYHQDAAPGGDLLHRLVLRPVDEAALHRHDVLQQLAEAVHVLTGDRHVVGHVAQMLAQLVAHPGVRPPDHGTTVSAPVQGDHQLVQDPAERIDGALQEDEFAGQPVGAPGGPLLPREDLALHLVDVVLEPRDGGGVVVHHPVQDRVDHPEDPVSGHPGIVAQAGPDPFEVGPGVVSDGDDEVVGGEDVDLADPHRFPILVVLGRAQDQEEHLPVGLRLGPLVGDDRVLHRQERQVEQAGGLQQLGAVGLGHLDPDHRTVVAVQRRTGLGEGGGAPYRLALLVEPDPALSGRSVHGQGRPVPAQGHGALGRGLVHDRPPCSPLPTILARTVPGGERTRPQWESPEARIVMLSRPLSPRAGSAVPGRTRGTPW